MRPNLFDALFEFRPRDGNSNRENFLTEAFAHLIRTEESVCDRWVSVLMGGTVHVVNAEIETRRSEPDDETGRHNYPDLFIGGRVAEVPFAFFSEHKWDSRTDGDQLRRYRKIADRHGKHARLVFIGASQEQICEAKKIFDDNGCMCFLWERVFAELNRIKEKSALLQEFLDFMKNQGLSPGIPLTSAQTVAFLQARDFEQCLQKLRDKLLNNCSWDVIPARFQPGYASDRSGKVAIRFAATDYMIPWIAVGFYFDEKDHRVALIDRKRGIDLILRIAVDPKDVKESTQPALDCLMEKKKKLRQVRAEVLLKGQFPKMNPYSIAVVHDCLADVIEGARTEADQLTAIHKRISCWLEILFNDGTLEKALRKSGLDAGMK